MGSAARSPLLRFLAYVRPYHRLIALATVCGMAKFILPSTMALTLKFITDRLVTPAAGAAAGGTSSDVIVRGFDAYLGWATQLLPVGWRTPWGAFNVLVVTLLVVYAIWAVATLLSQLPRQPRRPPHHPRSAHRSLSAPQRA